MVNISDFEVVMETISCLVKKASSAAKHSSTLTEKIYFQHEHKQLQKIETLLRSKYFVVEDIIKARIK